MSSKLLLLKDLIEISTSRSAMRMIHDKLQGRLDLVDVAHTILEASSGFCPLCENSRKHQDRYCPSCMTGQMRFQENRFHRYKEILKVVPGILAQILEDDNPET